MFSDHELDHVQGPKDIMGDWFFANFEDPCHSCPREDGEYVFIHGGPYEAHDMLESKFGGVFDDDEITDLADELDEVCSEWESAINMGISHRELATLTSVDNHSDVFRQAVIDIEELRLQEISPELSNKFYGMLFVNTVTTLETYLFDRFLTMVLNDDDLFRSFVGASPRLKKQKFSVSDIYKTIDELRGLVEKEISEIRWHNLRTVKELYKQTLGVDLGDLGNLIKYVNMRHDLAHRNGKNDDGTYHQVNVRDVMDCVASVKSLVEGIEDQMEANGLFTP